MASLHGIAADAAQLRHEFGQDAFNAPTILLAAKQLGLSAKLVSQAPERLGLAPLPALAVDQEGRFFVVARVDSITWRKAKDSVALDTKRLLAEHPEYLENYGVSKPGSRRFVVQAPGRASLGSERLH